MTGDRHQPYASLAQRSALIGLKYIIDYWRLGVCRESRRTQIRRLVMFIYREHALAGRRGRPDCLRDRRWLEGQPALIDEFCRTA